MGKIIPLNQDTKLDKIFNPSKSSKKSLEDRILAGFLNGRAMTLIIDSFPNSKSDCNIELTHSKISKVVIGTKSLTNVKKLSSTPFFLRRIYHHIAMIFNINGYKDELNSKVKAIADAYKAVFISTSSVASVDKEKQELIERIKKEDNVEIPSKYSDDVDVFLARLDSFSCSLHDIPSSLEKNVEFGLAFVRRRPRNYLDLHEELKANEQIAIETVSKDAWYLQNCPPELRNNFNVVLAAVTNKGTIIGYASPELQNNREIALAAINQSGQALFCGSPEMKKDKEMVLAAKKQNPFCLEDISELSEELQKDPEIIAAFN